MAHVFLEKAALGKKATGPKDELMRRPEKIKKTLRHPIRVRMLGILTDRKAQTQRELGKALSLSNAAIHYHLRILLSTGLIRLHSTRPGPKGITEKLYTADVKEWQAVSDASSNEGDLNFYLDYAASWMNERNREGMELLKYGDFMSPFIIGSYVVRAPLDEVVQFKRKIERLFSRFFEKHQETGNDNWTPFSVTFSIVPSQAEGMEESRNILEFEPGKSK